MKSSLYSLYRPKNFEEVVGQKLITSNLKTAIKTSKIAHAYLFCGTRGTGKTSLARIMARALNCQNKIDSNPCNQCPSCKGILDSSLLDVLEIDAASNNSVEDIRRICDECNFTPTFCKYKVYIIDEVHMLSGSAFNALLKTLEEPPEHVIFIMATTEPARIPATILSRCQRYDLATIEDDEMKKRLKYIADQNNIKADDSALDTLCQLGRGSMRDAISLLSQCQSQFSDNFSRSDVLNMVGLCSDTYLIQLIHYFINGEYVSLLHQLNLILKKGQNIATLINDIAKLLRDLLLYQMDSTNNELILLNNERKNFLELTSPKISLTVSKNILLDLAKLIEQIKLSSDPRIQLELFFLSCIDKYKFQKSEESKVISNPISQNSSNIAENTLHDLSPLSSQILHLAKAKGIKIELEK